jgi:hypothetical protein
MPSSVFECPTPKCAYVIDSEGLNSIQLKALRMWAKTCPQCHKIGHWTEKLPLLNTETTKTNLGGLNNAKANPALPKSQSQKRKAARYSGH